MGMGEACVQNRECGNVRGIGFSLIGSPFQRGFGDDGQCAQMEVPPLHPLTSIGIRLKGGPA